MHPIVTKTCRNRGFLPKFMTKFMVCNVNDKKCKKCVMATRHDWRIKIYSRICSSSCFTFLLGSVESSYFAEISAWAASFASLRLQLIPKGIFKLAARKEICFLLFEIQYPIFSLLTILSVYDMQNCARIQLLHEMQIKILFS